MKLPGGGGLREYACGAIISLYAVGFLAPYLGSDVKMPSEAGPALLAVLTYLFTQAAREKGGKRDRDREPEPEPQRRPQRRRAR